MTQARVVHASPALPLTDHLPAPSTAALRTLRRPALWALRRRWDIRIHDQVKIPVSGPAIIAANHIGTLDGPLSVLTTGRETFALAKDELFRGVVGWALERGGQIPLHRAGCDSVPLLRAIRTLRDGHVLVIFPEGARDDGTMAKIKPGLAYLALVTGAPIVPCAFLGTRLAGGGRKSLPPAGSRLEVVYGSPLSIPPAPWPRRREQIAEVSALLQPRLAAHVASAVASTGMELPGPVHP